MDLPSYNDIKLAHKRIVQYIHRTPVLTSSTLNHLLGIEFYFKCENFQKAGAFKFRGVNNALSLLSKKKIKIGIATHSSGNHAGALALAAKMRNINALIVMPKNSSPVKIEAVKGYGARLIFCENTLEDREKTLDNLVKETKATFIHPYNDFDIICGQGTAAKEFLEEVDNLEVLIVPVGGGGLLSGSAITAKNINASIKVIGAEPQMANDAYLSFINKTLILQTNPQTIADGLRTSLAPITFNIIINYVDNIITVSEKAIVEAMKLLWERLKIVVEPSAAVPFAVAMENIQLFQGKKVGIILSGGNVDLSRLPF